MLQNRLKAFQFSTIVFYLMSRRCVLVVKMWRFPFDNNFAVNLNKCFSQQKFLAFLQSGENLPYLLVSFTFANAHEVTWQN